MATFLFVAGKSRARQWDSGGSTKYWLRLLETQLVEATHRAALLQTDLTLDEPDDASYGPVEVTGRAVVVDATTNFRCENVAAQTSFSSQAGGEDILSGIILFDPDGTNTASQNVPIIHVALQSLITSDGNNIIIKWNNTNPGIVWYDA